MLERLSSPGCLIHLTVGVAPMVRSSVPCIDLRPRSTKSAWMAWLYLVLAGLCEILYAGTMPRTDGFTRLGPSLFCGVFIGLSMYLLALAARTIPVGTAYAVWVGIGAVGTAIYGIVALKEDSQPLRLLCFALILAGIVGLKLLATKPSA